jgi:hypothetical protein
MKSKKGFKIGQSTKFDKDIIEEITEILNNNISQYDNIENFPLFIRRINAAKAFALIEIFLKIKDLPGSVVECGVFKGQSLFLFQKLLDVYCSGDSLKKLIGFDTFKGLSSLSREDGRRDIYRDKFKGGFDSSKFESSIYKLADIHQKDSMIPRFKRIEFVKGNIIKTLPKFIKKNPGLRISLLNLDLDLYKPTMVALKLLYPKVVNGGIVILDEYSMETFPGESKAFEDFFKGKNIKLRKFNFTPTPGAYFIKESI